MMKKTKKKLMNILAIITWAVGIIALGVGIVALIKTFM